jgi:hypothetical protein
MRELPARKVAFHPKRQTIRRFGKIWVAWVCHADTNLPREGDFGRTFFYGRSFVDSRDRTMDVRSDQRMEFPSVIFHDWRRNKASAEAETDSRRCGISEEIARHKYDGNRDVM